MAEPTLQLVAQMRDEISGKLNAIQKRTDSFKSSLLKLGGALTAAFSVREVASSLFNVNREMETLSASIRTFSTSSKDAERSLMLIKDFADKTPFELNEVTQSFVRLKSVGLDPTKDALYAYGNVAAGAGKSMLQFAEAVADATTGEFERLKDFGIKASKQGDDITFMFKGVETTVKNSAQNIEQYLIKLGNTEFAGGIANKMDTIDGAVSTLNTSWDNLMLAFGDAGGTDLAKRALLGVAETLNNITKNMSAMQYAWASVSAAGQTAFEYLRHASLVFEHGVELVFFGLIDTINSVWNTIAESTIGTINFLIEQFNRLPGVAIETIDTMAASINYYSNEIKASVQEERALHEQNLQAIENNLEAYKKQLQTQDQALELKKEEAAATRENTKATVENTTTKKEADTVWGKLNKSIADNRVIVEESWDAMEKLDEAFIAGTISSEEYADALKVLEKNLLDVDTASKKTEKTTKKVETVFSRAMDRIKDNRKEVMESKDAQILLTQAYERGEITLYEYNEEMRRLNDTLDQSNSELTNLENSFGNFFDALITGSGDARSALRQLTSTLVDYIFNSQQAVAPSGGSSSGFLSGIGDFVSSAASGISDFVGGLFRAEGGPVFANNPYIVGERGPELFVPSTNGGIISNDKLGGGSNVTFNISALDGSDVMRVLTQNRREIAELVSGTARTYGL